MRLLSVFAQCFLTGALLIAQGQPTPDRSIQARNKAVAMRVFDEIFNQGNFQVADEIYAPDFRNLWFAKTKIPMRRGLGNAVIATGPACHAKCSQNRPRLGQRLG